MTSSALLPWLVPLPPLAAFLVIALGGRHLGQRVIAWIAAGGIAASALAASSAGWLVARGHAPPAAALPWLDVAGFHAAFALRLDPVAVWMAVIVGWVSLL